MLRAISSTHNDQKMPEITPADNNDTEQETTPEQDLPSTPTSAPCEVKRDSWAGDHSAKQAKMFFKTRTLSALPLGNTKTKTETRFLSTMKQRSLDENYMKNTFDNDEETALYFKLLIFGCLCMLVWKHIWLLPVMLVFLAIHGLKNLLEYFGVWLFFENQYNNVMCKIKCWWNNR